MKYSNFGSLDHGRENGEGEEIDLNKQKTVLQNQADKLIQKILDQNSLRLKYDDLKNLGFTNNEILTINQLLKQLKNRQIILKSKKMLEISSVKVKVEV